LAVVITLVALATPYMSEALQQQVAFTLQASVLRPFIATQERLTEGRARADEMEALRAQLDSLTAVAATLAGLADENATLRDIVGLAERAGPDFVPATILRPGTPGSESTFLVDVGYEHGVRAGATVVSARGLVGRIREVRSRSALGMDWANPDFRASAMLADGSAFGIVENVRGESREQDRLLLNGTAYHETIPVGAMVLTSGLGGLLPRGIPIGQVEGVAEEQGTWLRSYWLRPAVLTGSVTHVLVETDGARDDLSDVWAADSAWAPPAAAGSGPGSSAPGAGAPARADGAPAREAQGTANP